MIGQAKLNIPNDPREKWQWLKKALKEQGWTLRAIAQAHGLNPKTPGKVVAKPYPKMEKILAEALGLEPQQIWPERYDEWKRPSRV